MKIAVVGTGYVGLVTGTCFADSGNEVVCVDIDEAKVAALTDGKVPIFEPGLEEMVKDNIKDGRLSFHDRFGRSGEAGGDRLSWLLELRKVTTELRISPRCGRWLLESHRTCRKKRSS